jgi:hypothetical protein
MSKSKRTEFAVNQMGTEWSFGNSSHVDLSDDFYETYMPSTFDIHLASKIGKSVVTNIKCPYCKEGVLNFEYAKAEFCQTHETKTSETYVFKCSKKCEKGRFKYTERLVNC